MKFLGGRALKNVWSGITIFVEDKTTT